MSSRRSVFVIGWLIAAGCSANGLQSIDGGPDANLPLDLAPDLSRTGCSQTPCPTPTITAQLSNATQTLRGVTFDGNRYLAVGYQGTLVTSPDGFTWTLGSFGPQFATAAFYGIAAGPTAANRYVATIAGGAAVYSPDAVTWTQATGPGAPTIAQDVAWNGSHYVTVGSNGEFCTSPDGANWTAHNGGAAFNGLLNKVLWTGTQFVAVGIDGSGSPQVATSTDGATWTLQPGIASATSQSLDTISWDGKLLVATAFGPSGRGDIVTSPDAVTWTRQPSAATAMSTFSAHASMGSVGWTGSWWVAIGDYSEVILSRDGVNWQLGDQVSNGPLMSITFNMTNDGPRGLVAVGEFGTIFTAEHYP